MSRPDLVVHTAVRYRPPGPGLQRHRDGLLLEVLERIAIIKPTHPRDAAPLRVPLRHVWPAQAQPARRPVAKLAPPSSTPRLVLAGAALADGAFYPQPRPRGRIEDPAYLAWVRTLDCCACGPDQRTQTQAHHYGPRPKGRKTDDWLSAPLCALCHRHFHQHRTLPGRSSLEAATLLLAEQLRLLLRYFAVLLGREADRWYQLGAIAEQQDPMRAAAHLRLVLDLLVEHLALQRGCAP